MAHEIFDNRFIERSGRVSAWHGLGQKFEGALLPTAAAIQIGADFEVRAVPHIIQVDADTIDTGMIDLVRMPHNGQPIKHLGVASKGYNVLQNMTVAAAFDAASKHFPLETMGVLTEGKRFFLSLKSAPFEIKSGDMQDQLEEYIFATDSKIPGEAFVAGVGATRIVCANTLRLALESARFQLPIWHDNAAEQMVQHVGNILARVGEAREGNKQGLQYLATREFTIEQAVAAFTVAFPVPKESKLVAAIGSLTASSLERGLIDASEIIQGRIALAEKNNNYQQTRQLELQDMALASLNNMVSTGYGLNGYTVYNAVVEVEEHRANFRGNVAEDMMFGGRANNLDRLSKHLFGIMA